MAFTRGFQINIQLPSRGHSPFGPALSGCSGAPRGLALTALQSVLSILEQVSHGCSAMGSGRPDFGSFDCDNWAATAPLPVGRFLGTQNGNSCRPGGGMESSGVGCGSPQRNSSSLGNLNVERLVAALPPNRRHAARTHFPIIIREAQRQGVTSRPQLAYMLATANHESGSGLRMVEMASGRAYEGRRGLGNTQPGDGPRYRGRGYVQITGRRNYTDWSRRLGMDLVGNPALAEQPETAARILVGGMRDGTFTGRRLDRYVNANRMDFDGARRTIGGGRGADRVSEVARRLLSAMR